MLPVIPLSTFISLLLFSFVVYYICWTIYTLFLHPLHGYPGPFLARITTWHRWYSLRYQINANVQHDLHQKYGAFVRIAPDELQIADPGALDTISRREFVKTAFYDNFNPRIEPNRIEVFAERDETRHNTLKKLLLPLFRPESIARYEHHIDHVLQLFLDQMVQVVEGGETVDLAERVAMFSWDTVGSMVYGYEDGLGMLKGKNKHLGWMDAVRIMQWQTAQLGYVPKPLQGLYFVWQLILSRETRKGLMGAMKVVEQIRSLIKERKDKEAVALANGEEIDRNDWVGRMLDMCSEEVKIEKGGEVEYKWNESDLVLTLNAFVWAGSDTTGSVIGMILFFILRDVRIYTKLIAEINSVDIGGDQISYAQASKLPYLHACVQESLRHHGILGTGFPRVVPPGGAKICNQYIPGGYKVQMQHNVTHFSNSVFGPDADQFWPERWLVDEKVDGDEARVKRMEKNLCTFGIGNRVCLGRPLAMNEIYKFVPTVLKKYRFEILKEPSVTRGWFQQPQNFMVKVFYTSDIKDKGNNY